MSNSLSDALSPYLRQHASNPVEWQQWGRGPFEEAATRDVPVFVSIGYSTCHWCHVMARESFSDPAIAAVLNANFVAIKVDREEHPEVDAAFLTAASAFTRNLGWPLNVFVTPKGRTFFAGTYWPPDERGGHQSFRQVLLAVTDAWVNRRDQVEANAADVAEAIRSHSSVTASPLPDRAALDKTVDIIARSEDTEFGGFGTAPKFPMVPVIDFLLEHGSEESLALADRTLTAMAGSGLHDPVEGGFFRYATRRDWSEPHYERMLYDNAQLLECYAMLAQRVPERAALARATAESIAGFLLDTLRLSGGGFASAQNSESIVDGQLTEGDYYALTAEERADQAPPALDDKVLAGWNGLAIGALASAGARLGREDWITAAKVSAEYILLTHTTESGQLARASLGGALSEAQATLEDYGLLARGLLKVAEATGEVRWASEARRLVDACSATPGSVSSGSETSGSSTGGFATPGGGDPVLAGFGIDADVDPTEGALPSGVSALADASRVLYLLSGDRKYLDLSVGAMERFAPMAPQQPLGFGSALAVMSSLASQPTQIVVITDQENSSLEVAARALFASGVVCMIVSPAGAREWTDSGFELFEGRTLQGGMPTAYVCRDFVCQLPVTNPTMLEQAHFHVGNQ